MYTGKKMKRGAAELQPVGNAIFSLYTLGCSSCSIQLERKLKKVPGITEVSVNHVADMVEVKFDPGEITGDEIRTFMKKAGTESSQGH
jgi:copper chaperone CopZ